MANLISPTTVQKIGALLDEGFSARQIARGLGVAKDTVTKYARALRKECVCGRPRDHRGFCGPRYLASQAHKEVVAKVNADYQEPPRPTKPAKLRDITLNYPYCLGRAGEGNAILRAVSDAVSKSIPDQDRSDICQDLVVMILQRDIETSDLIKVVDTARRNHNRLFADSFISIDAPTGDGMTLGDIVSEPIWDAVPCGSSGALGAKKKSLEWA